MSLLNKYNLNSSDEELIKAIDEANDVCTTPEAIEYYTQYFLKLLEIKAQKKILEEQKSYNRRVLSWQVGLVLATWALVGATILLVFIK